MLVRNARAREIFAKHGCKVEAGGENVRFPRAVVEQHRAGIPPKFTFRARDPQFDRTVPDDAPVVITGSSAPDMVDPATGIARRALAADIARIAWLVDQLPNYDIFSVSTLADDAPPAFFSTTRLYAALKYCRKPIRISGPPEELDSILKLAHIIAGGEAAYMARPFITHHYCPCVSPLTMDYDSTETLIYYAERGLPGHPTLVPERRADVAADAGGHAGPGERGVPGRGRPRADGPAREGDDLLEPPDGGRHADRRLRAGRDRDRHAVHGRRPAGALLRRAVRRLHRALEREGERRPVGLRDRHVRGGRAPVGQPPLQHGGAPRRPHVVRLREGGHRRRDRGDAPPHPARASRSPRRTSPSTSSSEVGPGGMFADHLHTLERMRSTGLLPEIADREPRQGWMEKGGIDAQGRAMQRVRDILTRDAPSLFSPDVDARLRSRVRRHGHGRVRAAGGLDPRSRRGALRPGRAAAPPARPAGRGIAR